MAALVITPEIEAAAQRLAQATGQTPTQAVEAALQEKAERLRRTPRKDVQRARELLRKLHAAPVDMSLTEDEILGYDGDGIPEQPYLDR